MADILDALTTDRPYRPAMTIAAAREIIEEGAGTQFDPEVGRARSAGHRRALRAHRRGDRDERSVLIVDDDPFIRRLIATTLEDVAGFELREAADGQEALESRPPSRRRSSSSTSTCRAWTASPPAARCATAHGAARRAIVMLTAAGREQERCAARGRAPTSSSPSRSARWTCCGWSTSSGASACLARARRARQQAT